MRNLLRAALLLGLVVTATAESCDSVPSPPIAQTDCVQGWNNAHLDVDQPDGITQIVKLDLGVISRRVWVSNNGPECDIGFDLGGERAVVFRGTPGSTGSSGVGSDFYFSLGDRAYETTVALDHRTDGGWRACQGGTGHMQLGHNCPPATGGTNAGYVRSWVRGLALSMLKGQLTLPFARWLGPQFAGVYAKTSGSGEIGMPGGPTVTGDTYSYVFARDGHEWTLSVSTFESSQPCAIISCAWGAPVATLHPTPQLTILISSHQDFDDPNLPIPPEVARAALAHLKLVPRAYRGTPSY